MTRQQLRIALYALLAILAPAACDSQSDAPLPPDIVYGQEVCDGCGMIIDEARFAAASILTDGTARKFDDIGDMLVYHLDHPEAQVQAWFVHDYRAEFWIRGETAHYVASAALTTPMSGGIAAFEDRAAAEVFADEIGGQVFSLDQLRLYVHMTAHGP